MSHYSAGIKKNTARPDQRADQRLLAKMSPVDRPYPLNAVCPRPIPNSYWATPLLLACEYPWTPKNPYRPKLDALLKAGVRTFIDLTECGELSPYSNILCGRAALLGIDPVTIEYHNFPIRDRSLPQSAEYMNSVLDVLRDNEVVGSFNQELPRTATRRFRSSQGSGVLSRNANASRIAQRQALSSNLSNSGCEGTDVAIMRLHYKKRRLLCDSLSLWHRAHLTTLFFALGFTYARLTLFLTTISFKHIGHCAANLSQ
ncbi:dual specificity protein phosphatase [Lentinula edodes]|uniref:Dual specificity protein phosphatase n=1 Tax=Lentinula edodes TaxID=5353 RepID=A0A1Q3EJD6_LENED|nr:dual specificity protein phosphatase [Lentinula edodes]